MSNVKGFLNQICTICRQHNLEQIEGDRLNNKMSYQKMEEKYNLNHDTLRRHFTKCIKTRVDVDARVDSLVKEQRQKQQQLLGHKVNQMLAHIPPLDSNEVKQSFELTLSQVETIERYFNDQQEKELIDQGKTLTTVERADKILNTAEKMLTELLNNNASVNEKAKTISLINDLIKTTSTLKGETVDPLKHPLVINMLQAYNAAIGGCQSCSAKVLDNLSTVKR